MSGGPREVQPLIPTPREEQKDQGEDENSADVAWLQAQINDVDKDLGEQKKNLEQVDRLWNKRRDPMVNKIAQLTNQKAMLNEQLVEAQKPKNVMPPPVGPPIFSYTDDMWFGITCNVVVGLNLTSMFFGPSHPELKTFLKVMDQIFLAWYVFELVSKTAYHQRNLYIGKPAIVWWNWLDFGIVFSGLIDQWILPMVAAGSGVQIHINASVLRFLRLFRLLRFLKLVKAFLVSDVAWSEQPPFEMFMTVVIALNSCVMSLELDFDGWAGWKVVENIFLLIYAFELSLRLKRAGCRFWYDLSNAFWNYMDSIMVLAGAFELWMLPLYALIKKTLCHDESGKVDLGSMGQLLKLLKMMKMLRVLRLVRLLRMIKPLYRIVMGVLEALKAMQWVMILTILVLYAGAIVWTSLIGKGIMFGGDPPKHAEEFFGSVPKSLFSLFNLMNGDTSVVAPITGTVVGQLFFAGFMILTNWAVLAILTSVVSDNMMTSSARAEEEEEKMATESGHAQRKERLGKLFHKADGGTGKLSKEQFIALVEDPVVGDEFCDAAGLSADSLKELFSCCSTHEPQGPGPDAKLQQYLYYEVFVEHLDDEATPADKRGITRVMAKLGDLERMMEGQHRLMVRAIVT